MSKPSPKLSHNYNHSSLMHNIFQQYNETGPLKKVIIGRTEGYREVEEYVERVNDRQEKGLPSRKKLNSEFTAFSKILKDYKVEVLKPNHVGKFVYDQLTPRDIGVTIGDKFVICNMAKSSRRYEVAGIFDHILSMNGSEPVILIPPEYDMLLEGGDIIVDKGHIFVGLTRRTNQKGVDFLKRKFEPDFKVVSVPCKSFGEKDTVLHLDCVFNPVGEKHALISSDNLKYIPDAIAENYQLLEVTKTEQQALATNVLSIDKKTVISRDHPLCHRVNDMMRKTGLTLLTLPFDSAPATGGSFRCCTLPLYRTTA